MFQYDHFNSRTLYSLWLYLIKPFIHHMQQICSRRLKIIWAKILKYIGIGLNKLRQKEKLLLMSSLPFATMFSKDVCCKVVRKHPYVGKGHTFSLYDIFRVN